MMLIIMIVKNLNRKRAAKREITETRAANADAFYRAHTPAEHGDRPLPRLI
jgi:hypothetical protein